MDPNNAAYLALRNHPETTIRPISSDMRSPGADNEQQSPRAMEENLFKQVSVLRIGQIWSVLRIGDQLQTSVAIVVLTSTLQQPQAMAGFGQQETKYSAQQGFHQVIHFDFTLETHICSKQAIERSMIGVGHFSKTSMLCRTMCQSFS